MIKIKLMILCFMRNLFIAVCLISSLFSFGQTVEVIEDTNSIVRLSKPEDFHCIPESIPLIESSKRGVLKAVVTKYKKQSIVDVFNGFWSKSNEMGANAFHIDSIDYKTITSIKYTITIYSLSEAQVDSIYALYPTNKVYILGDLNPEALKFKPMTIKVNNIKTELPPTKFLSYQNKVGGETIISKGGIAGSKVWIKGKRIGYQCTYQ